MTSILSNAIDTAAAKAVARKKVSIDAPRGTHFFVNPDDLVIIGLDTKDGAEHPLYDTRIALPVDEHHVANVIHYGVLKPVLAKKDGERLIIIDGRQRVRRARAANKLLAKRGEELLAVPVIIKKGDDAQMLGISRAGNIHTADDPMTQAKTAERLISMGRTQAEVGVTLGVSESSVRNLLALLDLNPRIAAEVTAGTLPAHAALQLAQLPADEQTATLAEVRKEAKATGQKVTVGAVKGAAREKAGKVASVTPSDRIAKAETVIRKLAVTDGLWTKDMLADTLDKVIKALGIASNMDKLREEIAEGQAE